MPHSPIIFVEVPAASHILIYFILGINSLQTKNKTEDAGSKRKSSSTKGSGKVADAKKSKKSKVGKKQTSEPASGEDKVSDFFNQLSIYRGYKELMRVGEKDCYKLTEEEEDMVAYPFPKITFAGSPSWSEPGRPSQTYTAPNGKFFTVRDLGDAFADFERYCRDAHHSYFTGLRRCGPHTYFGEFDS